LKRNYFLILFLCIAGSILLESCGASKDAITTDDPETAFLQAKRIYDSREYVDAIDDFSAIKVKFPGSSVSDRIEFYLALSYYKQGEFLLGAYEYESFLKNYPLSSLYSESLYWLGMCYYKLSPKFSVDQDYTRYAIEEFTNFLDKYPADKNATDASARLQELRNKLAYKDYFVAQLYFKMDDYISAGIYYRFVYDNYIDTDWADAAMLGHAESLIELKRYDEAAKVLDKFYKLFPKSKLKSKADSLRNSIALK